MSERRFGFRLAKTATSPQTLPVPNVTNERRRKSAPQRVVVLLDRYARVFVFAPIALYPNNVAIVENAKANREL
jgi:hypothetical protein